MRTNYELVQILKLYDGANDVMIHSPNMDRVNEIYDWSFEGLNIFQNGKRK